MSTIDLAHVNAELGRNAPELVKWALSLDQTSIVTTNFRPFEAVILHLVTQVKPCLLYTSDAADERSSRRAI